MLSAADDIAVFFPIMWSRTVSIQNRSKVKTQMYLCFFVIKRHDDCTRFFDENRNI